MIRSATLEDVSNTAWVQFQAYHETYTGQWPQSYLDSLTVEKLAADWRQRLEPVQPEKVYFVAEAENQIVGFASGGKMNQEDLEFSSELYTLYLLKKSQGRGLGKQLFLAVTDFLILKNYLTMLCWVHSTNQQAQGFYKAMGGEKAREQMSSRVQGMLMYGFGWRNLSEVRV